MVDYLYNGREFYVVVYTEISCAKCGGTLLGFVKKDELLHPFDRIELLCFSCNWDLLKDSRLSSF
jgi:hypothetical protein